MPLIEIGTDGGPVQAWLATEAGAPAARPGVLVFADAFGLRARIYEMADRMAGWGYVVLVPHLFHRNGRVEDLAVTADLKDPRAREQIFAALRPRMQALTPERVVADATAYLSALHGLPGVAPGPVGVVGYCMGARLAVITAGAHPDGVAAVGGFHGGRLATDAPDSPHRWLATARAEFVFGHADRDPSMPPEAVAALGTALADAGLEAVNEVYAGAAHGYTMADTAAYDAEATERHFTAVHDLFARRLRAAGRHDGTMA